MVANNTLMRIAAYGAVVTLGTGVFVSVKIQSDVKKQPFFIDAIDTLRSHKGAVKLLGEPISDGFINIGNNENNFTDGFKAQFIVPVSGPKGKGRMYFWSERSNTKEPWATHRIELELKGDKTRRLLVKNTEKADSNQQVQMAT